MNRSLYGGPLRIIACISPETGSELLLGPSLPLAEVYLGYLFTYLLN